MSADEMEDIAYTIIWTISLDMDCAVTKIDLYQTMDMSKISKNEWPIYVDFEPSEVFVERAKKQIRKMDWSEYDPGTSDASAHSYLYHSNPDMPFSSNDNTR